MNLPLKIVACAFIAGVAFHFVYYEVLGNPKGRVSLPVPAAADAHLERLSDTLDSVNRYR